MSSQKKYLYPVVACAAVGLLALSTAALFAVGLVPMTHAEAAPVAQQSHTLGVGVRVAPLDGFLEAADKIEVGEESLPETMLEPQERVRAPLPKPKPKPAPPASGQQPAARSTSDAAPAPSRATDTTGWQSATASWYGPGFYGRTTASGAVLTKDMMNVAHRTLAFGTRIQFEYNGRTATAVVNDRGPHVAGRIFDLGPGTAGALGFSGVGTVRYRILGR